MSREHYHHELQRLQTALISLGDVVGAAIPEAMRQVNSRDLEGSRRLFAWDRSVNRRRYDIEAETLTLIATQQPVARDMRVLAAILEIAIELERIGDYAKGIASIHLKLDPGAYDPLVLGILTRMAQKDQDMLARALEAFDLQDEALARAIIAEDDEVDALFNQVFAAVLDLAQGDSHAVERANYLLWMAHNLERTADRVTNICERVIFTVTGAMEWDTGDVSEVDGRHAHN
jgi:phosphate transport system protein